MTLPKDIELVTDIDHFHRINGDASAAIKAKKLSKLERHSISFIDRSPFLIISTSDGRQADASPRGDSAGFVKVLDDSTLLIPERPGNRLADSMTNIIQNSGIGLIFLIPGMNETLRVNGDAYITNESTYLDKLKHKDIPPKLAIIVDVNQVYIHCAKALIRSKLWNSSKFINRDEVPTMGKMLLDQVKGEDAVNDAQVRAMDGVLENDASVN
jgi:PPOX class probable FMN-dependent enzyme